MNAAKAAPSSRLPARRSPRARGAPLPGAISAPAAAHTTISGVGSSSTASNPPSSAAMSTTPPPAIAASRSAGERAASYRAFSAAPSSSTTNASEREKRRHAALRQRRHPVTARPRVRGHPCRLRERRIVGRRELRIDHRPVAGPTPSSGCAAAILAEFAYCARRPRPLPPRIVDDAAHGVEVRAVAAPVERVGQDEREQHAGGHREQARVIRRRASASLESAGPQHDDRPRAPRSPRARATRRGCAKEPARPRTPRAKPSRKRSPLSARARDAPEQQRHPRRREVRHEVPVPEHPTRARDSARRTPSSRRTPARAR